MPQEILFSSLEEAEKKIKDLSITPQECRIKVGKKGVKLKLRTKKILYTLVFRAENTGSSSIEDIKKAASELATKIGCSSIKEL
ncbi:MAG: hypothetical protein QXK13_00495 [Fervidicoccaceae archaeon]